MQVTGKACSFLPRSAASYLGVDYVPCKGDIELSCVCWTCSFLVFLFLQILQLYWMLVQTIEFSDTVALPSCGIEFVTRMWDMHTLLYSSPSFEWWLIPLLVDCPSFLTRISRHGRCFVELPPCQHHPITQPATTKILHHSCCFAWQKG